MKKNNAFKKWIALFLSVAMVAVSGVTTNTSMSAAESTGVQESAAADTADGTAAAGTTDGTVAADTTDGTVAANATDGTAAANTTSASSTSESDNEDTSKTQEIALQDDGTSTDTAGTAEAEPTESADAEPTEAVAAISSEDNTEAVSVSSSSEDVKTAEEKIQEDLNDATKREYSYEDSNISVKATLTNPKAVPDSAKFVVTPVTQNTTGYNYDAYIEALNDDANAGAEDPVYTDDNTLLYDMAFYYDEPQEDGTTKQVEFEPVDGSVQIVAEFKKDQLTDDISAENYSDVEVAHLPLTDTVKDSVDTTAEATNISASDVQVEKVNADTNLGGTQSVQFDTDSFSLYAFANQSNDNDFTNVDWNRDFIKLESKITIDRNSSSLYYFDNKLTDEDYQTLEKALGVSTKEEVNNKIKLEYHSIDDDSETFLQSTQYQNDRALGIAGNFHIVAFNKAQLGAHTNGNILANTLEAGSNFGTNAHDNIAINESTYVYGAYSVVNGTSGSQKTNPLVVPSGTEMGLTDNGNAFSVNGTKIDKPSIIYRDTAGKKYIDVDKVKTDIENLSEELGSHSEENVTTSGSNPREYMLQNPDGVGVINLTAADVASMPSDVHFTGFESGHDGSIIVNVDMAGSTAVTLPERALIYIDRVQQGTNEVVDFSAGKIIWNFINASGTTIYAKNMSGTIIAPGASVELTQNINGTIIADNVHNTAETHRSDFTGITRGDSAYFGVKKQFAEGSTWPDNAAYSFIMTPDDKGTPKPQNSSVTVTQDNPYGAFGNIEFPYEAGKKEKNVDYIYTVKEQIPDDQGSVIYDTTVYKVKVTVQYQVSGSNKTATITNVQKSTDNGGTWTNFNYKNDKFVFTNSFRATSTKASITAVKKLDGRVLNDGEFSFTLKAQDNAPMPEGAKDGELTVVNKGETVNFGTITYDKAGTYKYTINEVKGDLGGVTYDSTTKNVTVTVKDNGDGTMNASVEGDGKDATFTNSYAATGSVTFIGTKTLEGQDLTADEFSFRIMEGIKEIATVKNNADGTINYPTIDYTLDDVGKTHKYTIYEINAGKTIDGVQYDGTHYTVNVTVTDNGDGTLNVVKDSIANALNFTNTYGTSSTSVTLGGTKRLENYPTGHQNPVFTFKLEEEKDDSTDTKGAYTDTATVEGSGQYVFNKIAYDKPGKHVYKVTESVGDNAGITYDSTTYEVTVNVTDNRKGELKATVSAKRDGKNYGNISASGTGLDFINSYSAKAASAVIYGSKTVNSGAVKVTAGQFRFNLLENGQVIDTAANDADGNYVFSNIRYTTTGTHTYTIEEQNAGEIIGGIRYQDAARTVTITVNDDGQGHLVANNATAAAFDNEQYGTITVGKNWSDAGHENYRPSTVVVDLIDASTGETVQTAELSEVNNWTATFDQLVPGGRYTVHEEEDSEYYAAENNDQVVTADANGTQVTLVNDFVHPAVTIYANKVLNGGTLTNGEFTFNLYRNSDPDTVVKTATNNASGEIFFTDIAYDAKGYTVREVAGDDNSIAYDSKAITYDAEGNITSTDHTVFTNTQRPIVLRVQKRSKVAPYDPLVGATYGLYQVVDGGNDVLVESQVSDENGYMYYGKIEPDTLYYFKEIAAPEGHEVDPYAGQKFQVKYTGNGEIGVFDENGKATTVGDITSQDGSQLLVQHTTEKTELNANATLTYSDDTIVATAEAVDGAFDEGTTMKVTQLTGTEADNAEAVVEAACGKITNNVVYYNVEFIDKDGNTVEPKAGDVTVTIQYVDSLNMPEGTDTSALKIVHLKNNGDTTEVQAVAGTIASASDKLLQTSFTSDSFSTFGIVEPADDSSLNSNFLVTAAGVADQVSELNVAKLDTSGKYVKGAVLQIIEKSTGTVKAQWTTTDGPQAFARWFDEAQTVAMNVDTDYILHEVSAPDGYELADDILFRINKYDSSITVYKYDDNGNLVLDQEAVDKWVSDTTLQMIDVPVEHKTNTTVKQKTIPNEKTIQGEDKIVHVTSIQAVKTGDTTPIALFVLLLAAAAAVLLILVYRGRKKKGN